MDTTPRISPQSSFPIVFKSPGLGFQLRAGVCVCVCVCVYIQKIQVVRKQGMPLCESLSLITLVATGGQSSTDPFQMIKLAYTTFPKGCCIQAKPQVADALHLATRCLQMAEGS